MKYLYCDIDSTVNNHWERIKKWAIPSFPGHSIHPRAFTREEIMKDKPLPGAKRILNMFKEGGYKIIFLTARKFDDAYGITTDWLDEHGFVYDDVIVVDNSEAKVPIIQKAMEEDKMDLFIDDFSAGQEYGPSYKNLYVGVIQDLQILGAHVEVFKGDWQEVEEKFEI
tara:strand:- start:309 stop:812 length:504 start_codon:yes stop_codon:yes gene_type:complete